MNLPLRSTLATCLGTLVILACSSNGPSVGISGSNASIVMGLSQRYTTNFPGIPDDSVEWSLPDGPDAGTIDSTGLYTAGLTAGEWRIVATALADSTTTDTVKVTVVPYATATPLGVAAYGVAANAAGVVAGADNSSAVRFLSGGGTVTATTGNFPVHLAYSPGGGTVFVTSMGGDLFRVTVATGAVADTADFGRSVFNVAVRPTDSTVYASTDDGWLVKLAPTTLAPLDSVHLASASNGLAFTSTGGSLWVSTIDAGILYRIDPGTLAKLDSFDLGTGLQRLAVAPSGDSVYVANQTSDRVYVVRPSTGTVTHFELAYTPHAVGISSDGSKLFIAQESGGRVSVFARGSLKLLGVVPVGGFPRNVAAVPGGGAMVVGTESDLVRIE